MDAVTVFDFCGCLKHGAPIDYASVPIFIVILVLLTRQVNAKKPKSIALLTQEVPRGQSSPGPASMTTVPAM